MTRAAIARVRRVERPFDIFRGVVSKPNFNVEDTAWP